MALYARILIPILLLLLFGRLVWQGAHSLMHSGRAPGHANFAGAQSESSVPPWVRDFTDSLDAGVRAVARGDLSAAEIEADRAESFVTIARLEGRPAPPDFFKSASAQLDRVMQQNPEDRRLFEHVTSVRIELAALRSSQELAPPAPAGGRIAIEAPRQIQAGQTLNPATLKGNYLDATPLPEISEILLPPPSLALADNIRVENVIIAGAAQTLDGIRWRNVTFIGTELRYEGGELSLEKVRFVRCRFSLPDDARGARIANAIVLAQDSITISEAAAPNANP